jgi:hypothetical protein
MYFLSCFETPQLTSSHELLQNLGDSKLYAKPYGYLLSRCKENPIYVFRKMKLCGLVPNFHIHVLVSYLYIPTIGPPILLQKNRQTVTGNIQIDKSLTDT